MPTFRIPLVYFYILFFVKFLFDTLSLSLFWCRQEFDPLAAPFAKWDVHCKERSVLNDHNADCYAVNGEHLSKAHSKLIYFT